MKFRTYRTSAVDHGARPSVIEAGRRVQPNSQLAGIRHFRFGGTSVKHAGAATALTTFPQMAEGRTAPLILKGGRHYLRALRAAEMKAWAASGGDVLKPAFSI